MVSLFLLASLKSCLLAGAGLLGLQCLPQKAFTVRRRLAVGTLWALLLVPWITMPGLTFEKALTLPETGATELSLWVVRGLLAAWGLGTGARLVRLAFEVRTLRQEVRGSLPHSHSPLAPVRCSSGVDSPCTWGFASPVILMPHEATEWPREAWNAALAHEEQHLRQHDGLHRLVASLIRAVFWWNPLVHALCRRLELESELCCDEAATEASGNVMDRRAYSELLVSLATGARFETAAAWASNGSLRERLQRLLSPAPERVAAWWTQPQRAAAVVLAAILVAACCYTPKFTILQREAMLRLEADPFPGE